MEVALKGRHNLEEDQSSTAGCNELEMPSGDEGMRRTWSLYRLLVLN